MARLLVGAALGLIVGMVAGAALGLHASEDDTVAAAAEAGVDEQDLRGAMNTTGLDARTYLIRVGELEPPTVAYQADTVSNSPAGAVSVSTSVAVRVACIESKESGGANVANARGSGAGGVLQYMESTFRAHAAEMGHPEYSRWVPWQARAVAAHDLLLGRRAQWTVAGC
jgi:hypothetical protein